MTGQAIKARPRRTSMIGRIVAIIGKDLSALGVFAAVVAATQFVVSAFLRSERDFPQLGIVIGDWRFDVAEMLFFITSVSSPVLAAVFVVMLVQQDNAIEPRHDWMVRPITPGELVIAKALMLLGVVVAPTVAGAALYEWLDGGNVVDAWPMAYIALMACIFLATSAWISSSIAQAMLVPIAAAAIGLLVVLPAATFVVEVMRIEALTAAMQAPIGAPVPAVPAREGLPGLQARIAEPSDWTATIGLFVSQLAIAIAAAAVVLWLLLAQRRVLAARLAFAGFFVTTLIVATVQISVMDGFVSVSAVRVATLEERMEAFRANDADGDGRLTRDEYRRVLDVLGFPNQLDSYWRQRDRDRDGFITMDEYTPPIPVTPPAPPQVQRMTAFTTSDANGDGRLDKQEYAAALEQLGFAAQLENYWSLRDTDRDGFISREEYAPPL